MAGTRNQTKRASVEKAKLSNHTQANGLHADSHTQSDYNQQQDTYLKNERKRSRHTKQSASPPKDTGADTIRSSSDGEIQAHAKEDEQEDDEDADETDTADENVEDICLACEGACSCGAAAGTPLYVRSPVSKKSRGGQKGRPASATPRKVSKGKNHSTHVSVKSSLRRGLSESARDTRSSPEASAADKPKTVWDAEISDFELDIIFDSDADDEDIERSEEKALRDEFDRKTMRERAQRGDDSDSETYIIYEDLMRERRQDAHKRKGHQKSASRSLPASGGLGVVTWSDYDSVETADDEDYVKGIDDFDMDLDELLAFSEAVVRPTRTRSYEVGEMWFEDVSHQADGEEGDEDDEEETRETIVVMDRWDGTFFGDTFAAGTDDDCETVLYGEYNEETDGGDTTDSLDSDDHVALVRFGIEVDSDSSSAASWAEGHSTGFASLADVQAPTTADLAFLPQLLFARSPDGRGATVNLKELGDDPDEVIKAAAEALGVDEDTAVCIIEKVDRSFAKMRIKAKRTDIASTDETRLNAAATKSSPAMGVFQASDRSMVIDGTDAVASPFSTRKRITKRLHDSTDDTPASYPSRARADSKASITSGMSATESSYSGGLEESPFEGGRAAAFSLHDLLEPAMLGAFSRSLSPAEHDSDSRSSTVRKRHRGHEYASKQGLCDLERWDKVPIGAFRSRGPRSSPHVASNAPHKSERQDRRMSNGTLFRPADPALVKTTRQQAIARMMDSPLLGPYGGETQSVPSHRQRRKAKQAASREAMHDDTLTSLFH